MSVERTSDEELKQKVETLIQEKKKLSGKRNKKRRNKINRIINDLAEKQRSNDIVLLCNSLKQYFWFEIFSHICPDDENVIVGPKIYAKHFF